MTDRKWDEELEQYLMEYLRENEYLDIEAICAEKGIGEKSLRRNINGLAGPMGMRVEGITRSILPRIVKGIEPKEPRKKAEGSVSKSGSYISSEPKVTPKGYSKFICNVNVDGETMWLVCSATDKEHAEFLMENGYNSVTSVNEVRTMEEHYNKTHITTGMSSRGRMMGKGIRHRR